MSQESLKKPNLEYYKKQAKDLLKQWKGKKEEALWRIKWNHIGHEEKLISDIPDSPFTLRDAQFVVARENGYENWCRMLEHISSLHRDTQTTDQQFETAADAICNGSLDTLSELLSKNPSLVYEQSSRVHKATLLHYIAANGIEEHRQKTPENIVEITRLLLDTGSEVDALANTYDGGISQTTLCLLVTSGHPRKAGAQLILIDTLLDYGAKIDGLGHKGRPVFAALQQANTAAAQHLYKRGAAVDDLLVAAGAGNVASMEVFFDSQGKLKGDAHPKHKKYSTQKLLNIALIDFAAQNQRVENMRFLIEKGAEPQANGENQGMTAMHWAGIHKNLAMMELLLENPSINLETMNAYEGTVLDQVIWSATNADHREHHEWLPIINKLIEAGAKVYQGFIDYAAPPFKPSLEKAYRLQKDTKPGG